MLEITVWDVNHGSAAYVKTPNNRHVVVDLGDAADAFSPLRAVAGRGVRQLDVVVITHPHRDHLDDIFNFSALSPRVLWRPNHLSAEDIRKGNRAIDTPVVERYLEIDRNYNQQIQSNDDPTVPANFGGMSFQVFIPQFCDRANLNNHSLVVVVSYADLKMVIPGDNESPSWKELLLNPTFVSAVKGADVLLASHHGRDAGYCSELFDAMGKPRLVVISDGRFGDTSATGRYSNQAIGWTVYNSVGVANERKCVTTRNDGHITIKFGWNNQQRFLEVTTSKPDPIGAAVAQLLGGA